jgi:hypothetical protein
MTELTELKHDIATSLFVCPCNEEELCERDFLKNKSNYGIDILVRMLHKDDALYYKSDKMHIKRKWAKKNLKDRELDFRTDRQKYLDGLTPFAREVYGL